MAASATTAFASACLTALALVLSWGDDVEVVGPDTLRAQIGTVASKVARMYRTKGKAKAKTKTRKSP